MTSYFGTLGSSNFSAFVHLNLSIPQAIWGKEKNKGNEREEIEEEKGGKERKGTVGSGWPADAPSLLMNCRQ